jgi:C1A family cysteine protease
MPSKSRPYSMSFGWIPDYPDFRDYTESTPSVRDVLLPTGLPQTRGFAGGAWNSATGKKTASLRAGAPTGPAAGRKRPPAEPKPAPLPSSVDLREWCSPVEDQKSLGSCTANAGAGLIEYYERKAFGRHTDASRLFLYKATRNLMKQKGDIGAYLRTTMGAMILFGVPPEEYWPYSDSADKFDKEPPAFCYAFAQNYKTLQYYRHDPPGILPGDVLERVRAYLAAGHPSMFGFTVYSSIEMADDRGAIPFPSNSERILGGHAVDAVGYDDRIVIENRTSRAMTKGALLIRNSWGEEWGDGGYGWLPYEYILRGLAEDFWCVLKKDWVDTGVFNV